MSRDALSAAIVGSPGVCATSNWRRGVGRGRAGVSVLFCHEGLEPFTTRSNGNDRTRRGIWPCVGQSPPELILGHPGFQPGVAVTVQFGHREGGFGVGAWADDGVSQVGMHALRVRSTEAMLEKDL